MKAKWLHKNNSKKLIIFFNGWSLDENIVNHLQSQEYDVLMFFDYENLEITEEILSQIRAYQQTYLIAWSFGVWALSETMDKFEKPSAAIALNGTPIPIDNSLGIPQKIFDFTLSTLSERTYENFFRNMFWDFKDVFFKGLPKREIENQKQELAQIKHLSAVRENEHRNFCFDRVIISQHDKIIQAKNQMNYWQNEYQDGNCRISIIENSGHCVFYGFKTWGEIINYG